MRYGKMKNMEHTACEKERVLLHLLACALVGRAPSQLPSAVDWPQVYRLSLAHGVSALAFLAVERIEPSIDAALFAVWKESHQRAMVRDATQAMEFEAISAALTQAGIPFIPLKGLLLKAEYPTTAVREMSDLDLLLPRCDLAAARAQMEALGYEAQARHAEHHDVYHKLPIMNVELHNNLNTDKRFAKRYFRDRIEAAKTAGRVGAVLLDAEDTYFHLVLHAAEHLKEAGIGIRQFLDLYLYRTHHPLDRNKVDRLLDACGYRALEAWMWDFARLWFEGLPIDRPDVSPELLHKMELYFLTSTVYGTRKQLQLHAAIDTGKKQNSLFLATVRNFFSALFPPLRTMQTQYPVLKRHGWLLPLCWVARWIRSLFCTRSRAVRTITRFHHTDPRAYADTKDILDTLFPR